MLSSHRLRGGGRGRRVCGCGGRAGVAGAGVALSVPPPVEFYIISEGSARVLYSQ